MSEGYVFAGYGITVGSLALYAARVLHRGRVLARALPPEQGRPDGGAPGTDAGSPPAGDQP